MRIHCEEMEAETVEESCRTDFIVTYLCHIVAMSIDILQNRAELDARESKSPMETSQAGKILWKSAILNTN